MKRVLTSAITLAALAAPALAEGWNVHDLGNAKSIDVCMARAEQASLSYRGAHGAGEINAADWVVYMYFIEPGDQYATFTCLNVDGVTRAVLHVFGTDSPENRQFTTDELVRLYNY